MVEKVDDGELTPEERLRIGKGQEITMKPNEQINALREARQAIMEVLQITTSGQKIVECQKLRDILCPAYLIIFDAISKSEKA